jgi:hypothetical protein
MPRIDFRRLMRLGPLLIVLALLAACGGRNAIQEGTAEIVNVPAAFDLTIAADKDGQFDFDGATLTVEDLRGHLRYRAEVGKPVQTLLLKPGEKQKINNNHIAGLAGICRDLHIEGYVQDNDGRLKRIKVVD